MFRAYDRLRGGENPQVGPGEISRRRPYSGNTDEIRR